MKRAKEISKEHFDEDFADFDHGKQSLFVDICDDSRKAGGNEFDAVITFIMTVIVAIQDEAENYREIILNWLEEASRLSDAVSQQHVRDVVRGTSDAVNERLA